MSTTRNGPSAGSSSAVAPRNDRRASSSPPSSSGRTPTTASAASKNSSRLDASRAADVAVIRTRSTPRRSRTARYSVRTATVRSMASGASRPVASTPWPRRVMRMSRSRVGARRRRRPAAGWSWCRSRSAARRPVTPASAVLGQAVGHPPADGVVAAGQVPGVVGVEALDALAGAADAARRPGAGVAGGQGRVALGRVAGVGPGQLGRVDGRLRRPHPARRLQAAHQPPQLGVAPASTGWASACRRPAGGRCG